VPLEASYRLLRPGLHGARGNGLARRASHERGLAEGAHPRPMTGG